jgi:hypothetical protein
VCQACAKQVAFVIDEDLRFVFQPTECTCVNNPIAIALKLAAITRCWLWMTPSTA